jgi:hypothetical protein
MMPFGGCTLDQPYMSMQVLKLIQLNYRKHLNDQMKKMASKGKH